MAHIEGIAKNLKLGILMKGRDHENIYSLTAKLMVGSKDEQRAAYNDLHDYVQIGGDVKVYDGCSGGMSIFWKKIFKSPPPWEFCCDIHDQAYAEGGTAKERRDADTKLFMCVLRNGHPVIGFLMWCAVRIGGVPYLPFSWRWGFDTNKWWYEKDSQP